MLKDMQIEVQNLEYCDNTLKLTTHIEAGFIDLGRRLMEIRNKKMYVPQWTSFPEYLDEMDLSESQASKLINIFQKLVIEHGFSTDELLETKGWAILAEGLPFIKDKESAKELVDLAKIYTVNDMRKHYKELKTGLDMSECKHENYYTIKICRDCGFRESIDDSKYEN